ncbi:MAG: hypothetical protein FWF92_08155 [Oscillospiraceae bacterium]|nr:hypothetical protein [Oscillospiraceae bacterium]
MLRKRLPQNETVRLTVKPIYMSRETMEASSIQANMNTMIPESRRYRHDDEYIRAHRSIA